ncbi:hypothetical protein [Kribbella pittospori]|uniref:hypothetical protein n=1 Tax=Kribbella pittospori TaxID=722689 RepID=UPI001EDE68E2|nr:hypothetical protein [Kribbella pittospori]
MKVLAWLAFPVVATLLAMCWAAWRGRSRGPRRSGGAFDSVEDFRRFNDALAAPGPRATPERRRRGLNRAHKTDSDKTDVSKADESDHVGNPSPDGQDAAGESRTADRLGPAGTLRAGGTLGSAKPHAIRKLGTAEMFGSTEIAGQGS